MDRLINKIRTGELLIVGHGRHGKDLVAQILKDGWGYTFCSSSYAAAEKVIYPATKEVKGYTSVDECFEDRHNNRQLWHELISDYNTPDKTKLAREILKDNNIYVGMRCKEELLACTNVCLFDCVVWVDSSLRQPPESKKSNSVTKNLADYVIDNNGTHKELVYEVWKFMSWFYDNHLVREKV